MTANQTSFEQRSVIRFLVFEKCKQYKNYKRICDVYGEPCFSNKKMFINGQNVS